MATIKDIARKVGVAPSVVSRALNNRYGVKETTKKRILKIAEELNYYPNTAAQSLVTRKTNTIGIMMADISEPYYSQIIKGMEYVANQTGYMLLFSNSFEQLEHGKVFQKMVDAQRVDGLIIVGSNINEKNFAHRLIERNVPFILIERNFGDSRVNCFWSDNIKGGYLATKHLIEKGHRRIAHIAGNLEYREALDRLEGYKKALIEHGIAYSGDLVAIGKFIWQQGYTAMKELLDCRPRCTAVFAANDSTAYGAVQAIYEAKLKIPADIAIIGFDDLQFSALLTPPLSTLRQPRYEMGRKAMETLVAILQGEDVAQPVKICFESELIIRNST